MRSRFTLVPLWLAVLTLPAWAAPGYEITAAQVAGVMRDSGISVSDGQVHLLSDVVARTSAPDLLVDSMTPMGSERMMVRLRCAQPKACLPFEVTVHTGQIRIDPIREARLSSAPLRGAQPAPARTEAAGTEAGSPSAVQRQSVPPSPAGKEFIVRSGSPALLLLEGEMVHVRLIVVCLENGVAGQTIRVASKANRKTFTAEVGSDGVLRGSL